jgi:hypothetical protein
MNHDIKILNLSLIKLTKQANMKKIYFLLSALIANFAVSAQCTDVFISEYLEGSSNNKGLELYNPSGSDADLSDYSIVVIGNGGSFTNTFDLYGTLASDDVFILTTDQMDPATQAKADTALSFPSVCHFNGDDAVCLLKGTDTIDIIGERRVRTNWTVGTGSTKDYTLVRKATVKAGQTDWTIGATEWDVYPKNTWSYLGSHSSDCHPSAATEPTEAAQNPTQEAEDVISVYSETYGNYAGADFYPNWGQSTQFEIFEIGMDSMIKYSNLNYQGIVLGSNIDASEMENLHLDIWTADVDNINIFPISASTAEFFVNQKLTAGSWNSIDIPMSEFTSQGLSIKDIKEFKFDDIDRSNGTVFIDNIYFWKEPTLIYRKASISELFQLDADLTPTNLDSLYEINGVVYGPDFDGNAGYSFTLVDDTKGINIHSFVDVDGVADIAEGDDLTVKGHIVFYSGLLELRVDSITVNSQGNALAEPTEVEKPDESTESEFIVLRKVWLAEEATVWPDNGNLLLTNEAKDTFQIRVDRDVADMVGQPIDYDTMTITGLGGQFTFDVPADNGYQIFPRMLSDVSEYEAPVNNVRNLELLAVELYPNPTSSSLTVRSTTAWNSFEIYSLQGVKVLEGALPNNSLEVSSLISGSYILKLQSADANGVARFIVNK